MNDKSQKIDFIYNIGDCVTYNFTNDDGDDDILEYAVIIDRRIVDAHKAYQVVWLDNLDNTLGKVKYEYLENQIKKA
jgi:hypothetical protein